MSERNEVRSGLVFGLSATLLWGSYPLWYKPLAALGSYNLLAWRIIFAELFLIGLILATKRLGVFRETLSTIKFTNVLTVAALLGFWWLVYIYGILTGRVLEVAFGYFLSPIMSMIVSRFFFKEKMSGLQNVAIVLAVIGVALMGFQLLSLQSFPWIAIVIGFCYSFYGIFKKRVPGDSIVVQSMEIGIMVPFAAIFLCIVGMNGGGHNFLHSTSMDLLLLATGLITVLPLWWYSRAAKQLPMITLSFLQFVPPICNFLLATLVYHETVSPLKMAAFLLIWAALAVFTWNSIAAGRKKVAENRLKTA